MSEQQTSTPDPTPAQRAAAMASIGLALVVVWAGVVTWIGHADLARTVVGIMLGTLVGFGLGILGPGLATSVTGLVGPVIRVVLGLAALGLVALVVIAMVRHTSGIAYAISLSAAALMLLCWIPLSRLSGK